MPDTGYYVKGTCGCACEKKKPGPCFYHGCGGCHQTRESAKAAGLVSGHEPDCPLRPRLETETL